VKVFFAEKDRDKIMTSIKNAMGGRELAKIVNFNLGGGKLEVVISKMGTSTLTFTEKENPQGLEYLLSGEKIAFTHKPFKDDVTEKIVKVIKSAGGKVT
jgi:hypothetical protein